VRYQGNIKFRKLVQNRMRAYREAYRHVSKDAIAQEVVDEIISRGGRFLRRVESITEATELGVPQGVEAWTEVDRESAIGKCKQAFRDEKRAAAESKDGDQGFASSERSSEPEVSSGPLAAVGAPSFAAGLVGSGHDVAQVQQARQQPHNRTQAEMDLLQRLIQVSQSAVVQPQQSSNANQLSQLRYLPSLSSLTSTQLQALVSQQQGHQRQQNSAAVAGGGTDHPLSLLAAIQLAAGASSATAAPVSSTVVAVNNLSAMLNRPSAGGINDHRRLTAVHAGLRPSSASPIRTNQGQQAPPKVEPARQPETLLLSQMFAAAAAAHRPPDNGESTAAPLSLQPGEGTTFLPIRAPPDILEERARLVGDALRRYQTLRGYHPSADPNEEENSSSSGKASRSSSGEDASSSSSLSAKKKSPAADGCSR